MKTTIKILIPLLVLAGIGFIIYSTQSSIDELHDKDIDRHDFKEYVNTYSEDNIEGKSVEDARSGYAKLYDIITTEASVEVRDSVGSSKLLEPSDANQCYEKAFEAYFPTFRNYADNFFRSSSWSSQIRTDIKNEATSLKKCMGTSMHTDSLDHYIQYVTGYSTCIGIIKRAQSCNSLNTYNYVSSNYNKYTGYPYRNCTDLRDISSALGTAEMAWKSNIENEVRRISNQDYCSDIYVFTYDRTVAESQINDLRNNTSGNGSWANAQTDILSRKAQEVARCN